MMTTRLVAGKTVEIDEEGFLVDPQVWDSDIARALAEEIGIDLTPTHWQVINFTRQEFEISGETPSLRRITTAAGVPTKELYTLFPKKPAKKVAYISGLHKPSGCI